MRFCLLAIIIIAITSCSSDIQLKTINTGISDKKPKWTLNKLKVDHIKNSVRNSKETVKYDPNIFKFIEKNSKPVKKSNKENTNLGNNINLIINNHKTNEKDKVKKVNLSRIERLYHDSIGLAGGKAIKQAGYKELKSMLPKTSPVNKNYLLGQGDSLDISVTGSLKIKSTFKIDDNGNIFIPAKVGSIFVNNKNIDDAEKAIYNAIKREYKNFKLNVSIKSIKNIRVIITGRANAPGALALPANSTLLDALCKSGGISKDGSLRKVILKQKGKNHLIDLYKVFYKGTVDLDIPLNSGDQIIIPPIGKTVCITGINGSGIYEITENSLSEILPYHGKINSFSSKERIFIEKTSNNKRKVFSLDYKSALIANLDDTMVVDFQSISSLTNNTVTIKGEILRPGKYPWQKNMKVSELLKKAEGFLPDASLHLALIKRKSHSDMLYQKTGKTGVYRVRDKLIWVELDKILGGFKGQDVVLQKQDTLQIFSLKDVQDTPEITISGAVRKPGTFAITQNMTLADAFKLAGMGNKNMFPGEGVIVRKVYNTEKGSYDVKIFHFPIKDVIKHNQAAYVQLEDGDRIIIRKADSKHVEVSIKGEVKYPGTYILPSGSKITTLINAAGGLSNEADLRAADFRRALILNMQQKRLRLLTQTNDESHMLSQSLMTRDGKIRESYAGKMEMQRLDFITAKMRERQLKGRIVIDMQKDTFPESEDNVLLKNGDSLNIPPKLNSVMVMGHVYSPNAFLWQKKLTVKEYITKSGGYLEEAGKDTVYIVLADGRVFSSKQIGHKKLMSIKPGPGDVILIPKAPMKRSKMAVTADYINLLRMAVETGVISKGLNTNTKPSVGISSDKSETNNDLNSYEPLLRKK